MPRGKEHLTKNLFGEPKPGERGYLEPGFHRNATGEIEDDKGNVYCEDYAPKSAAEDKFVARAREFVREHHGDVRSDRQEDLVMHYAAIWRREAENKKQGTKNKKQATR